jgi:hypothetical protein
MTKREIINGHMTCMCGDIYKSRKLVAPDCCKCQYETEIEAMMDEYAEYVAKETWYAALTEKRNLSFNEFWTEFKAKEDEQGNKV